MSAPTFYVTEPRMQELAVKVAVTVREAAFLASTSEHEIRAAICSGALAARQVGHGTAKVKWLVSRRALEAWSEGRS